MEFHKPGPNKRVCAFLIDSCVGQFLSTFFFFTGLIQFNWIIWALYILFKDCFNGKSLGKRLVGLQVIDLEGNVVKPRKALLRNILMVIPIFPLIEYIVMRCDKAGRRLGDQMAKSEVTDLKPLLTDVRFLWISILVLILFITFQGIMAYILYMSVPEIRMMLNS